MKLSKIRGAAREALTGKWGKGALITLAYLAFFFAIGFIIDLFEEGSLISNLLGIATIIIEIPVVFGLGFAFIKLKRNEEVKAFDFLNLGFSNFGRSWKVALRTMLKMLLPIILVIVSVVFYAFALTTYLLSSLTGVGGDATLLIISLIVYVVAIIFTLVVALLYSLTTFIAYDNPNMTALEVVNESKRMMKGNRGKLFLLELSFIGWAILAVLTLGIGYLWLLPYMQVAYVCFYEYLLGKKDDSNVDSIQSDNAETNVDPISEN